MELSVIPSLTVVSAEHHRQRGMGWGWNCPNAVSEATHSDTREARLASTDLGASDRYLAFEN